MTWLNIIFLSLLSWRMTEIFPIRLFCCIKTGKPRVRRSEIRSAAVANCITSLPVRKISLSLHIKWVFHKIAVIFKSPLLLSLALIWYLITKSWKHNRTCFFVFFSGCPLKSLIPHPSNCNINVWMTIIVIDGFDGAHQYTCCGQHVLLQCSWKSSQGLNNF